MPGLLPGALDQSGCGRGKGPAAPSDRKGLPAGLRHGGRFRRGLCPDQRRFSPPWRAATARSAASTAWPPWSRRSGPSGRTTRCFSIAATPGQGSYTSLATRGGDMVEVMNALGVEVMTGHWEFTYGTDRVQELVEQLDFPFLAGNVRDTEWEEAGLRVDRATLRARRRQDRSNRPGLPLHAGGQPALHDPDMVVRYPGEAGGRGARVAEARAEGCRRWSCCSATTASTSTASWPPGSMASTSSSPATPTMPCRWSSRSARPCWSRRARTASFFRASISMSRTAAYADYRYRLIPVFSDAIEPDPEMAALVDGIRAPYAAETGRTSSGSKTESLLYRRGNFNGTFDDLICQAHAGRARRGDRPVAGFPLGRVAAARPGHHHGGSYTRPPSPIRRTSIACRIHRQADLKEILEDVADNLFNPDPYYQQGGDMVRVGGLGLHH